MMRLVFTTDGQSEYAPIIISFTWVGASLSEIRPPSERLVTFKQIRSTVKANNSYAHLPGQCFPMKSFGHWQAKQHQHLLRCNSTESWRKLYSGMIYLIEEVQLRFLSPIWALLLPFRKRQKWRHPWQTLEISFSVDNKQLHHRWWTQLRLLTPVLANPTFTH